MTREAVNLTQALKGDNKQQGNWGEVVLACFSRIGTARRARVRNASEPTERSRQALPTGCDCAFATNKQVVVDSENGIGGVRALLQCRNGC